MNVRGIDVSDYQGQVNWKAVAASGMTFGITKATEGTTFVAETFTRNWSEIRKSGMVRGAYHFFRPRADAVAQARNFLNVVQLETGDFPAVLDIETTDGLSTDRIIAGMQAWLNTVEEATKRRPIVYTYPGFWESLGNLQNFTGYPLWIAHYTTAATPWVPGGWATWLMWQYTDRGSINGVAGGVDINYFNPIELGQKGAQISAVQTSLKSQGFDPGVIDGSFGPNTKQALEKFQAAINVPVTGSIDPQTWAYLVDQGLKLNPQPNPQPSPQPNPPIVDPPVFVPIVNPTPPKDGGTTPSDSNNTAMLLNVVKYYQNLNYQNQALNWLEEQLPRPTLLEFARRWRNVSQTTDGIRLVNVAKFYKGLASQNQALTWLQTQIPGATMTEFGRRWQAPTPATATSAIRLVNAAKYYQGLPQQEQALEWLQKQLTESELQEFARRWRGS